jgi:hypothetical protein
MHDERDPRATGAKTGDPAMSQRHVEHFAQLLQHAAREPQPQRLLFVFTAAELPPDASPQQRARFRAVIDKQHERRAARDGFNAERAGAGEEVEHARALKAARIAVHQDIEQRFAQPVRRWPDSLRRRSGNRAAAQSSADNAHRA